MDTFDMDIQDDTPDLQDVDILTSDKIERVNELCPELLAIHSLNFAVAYNAPARGTMMSSHFSQRPVIAGSEPDLIQTGVAEEFGKYTFNVKMPEDGVILRVIPRYRRTLDESIPYFNPETTVVYRSNETGVVDYFTLPYYASYHSTFGFQYEFKEAAKQINYMAEFQKDTVFADSPAVKGESHYTYGRNLNVIFMSHPNVGLDGYVISRDVLEHFKFKIYETRSINLSAAFIPVNLYGDENKYKSFPDIGEYVREDGLLMARRPFDANLAPALFSKDDLREVDYLFDDKIYVRAGKGRVVDLSVIKTEGMSRQLPSEVTEQLDRYAQSNEEYYRELTKLEEQLIYESKKYGGNGEINISPALQRLLVTAKAITGYRHSQTKAPITLTHKREPLDTWRLTFVIEYDVVPTTGFKVTCQHGGKGVICRIEEPENMPVDADGNRADIISGPDSIPGRMNIGRLYAPYFNAAARDVRRRMLEELGYNRHHKHPISLEELMSIPEDRYQTAVQTLLTFYHIVSPRTLKEFTEVLSNEERLQWMLTVLNKAIYCYIPIEDDGLSDDPENPRKFLDEKVEALERTFDITYGPVSYVGRSGKRVTTKNNFRIAPMYFMLLDKIADTWLAADVGKHNNFGILAAVNEDDKFSTPWRRTPPRTIGETEGRLYCMYGGKAMIAEMMDRSGNLTTQKEMAKNIHEAENPSRIERLVDREKIPYGNARPNQILRHIFRCMGFDTIYRPENLQKPKS